MGRLTVWGCIYHAFIKNGIDLKNITPNNSNSIAYDLIVALEKNGYINQEVDDGK